MDIIDEIKSFKDNRVWISKKCRMEAEARMNRNHMFSHFLVNYYTFIVLSFSIWSLIRDDNESNQIALFTVIASVGLFGISLFISSMNYKERALLYKDSYINLSEIEIELNKLLRDFSLDSPHIKDSFYRLQLRYNEQLSKIENHHEIDYIKVSLTNNIKKNWEIHLKYYWFNARKYFFQNCLILMPIALIVYYILS